MFYIPNKSKMEIEGYADLRLEEIIRGFPVDVTLWAGQPNIWRPYKYKMSFYSVSYQEIEDV